MIGSFQRPESVESFTKQISQPADVMCDFSCRVRLLVHARPMSARRAQSVLREAGPFTMEFPMSLSRKSLRACVAACALIVSLPSVAAVFSPNRFDDPVPDDCTPADCSLREAVIAANELADQDLIMLADGTYELTQLPSLGAPADAFLDLNVTSALEIRGQGTHQTIIRNAVDTNNLTDARILTVQDTVLSLVSLTLRDGYSAGFAIQGEGGCLLAERSELFLEDVRITNCHANFQGGGVLFDQSSASFESVLIDQNDAFFGGGISARESYLYGSEVDIAANVANRSGGGIHVYAEPGDQGTSTIRWQVQSHIRENTAQDGAGINIAEEAILIIDPAQSVSPGIHDLLVIEGNVAIQDAGGIRAGGRLSARWLALRFNDASQDGGALLAESLVEVDDSELANNSAGRDGGGIQLRSAAAGSRINRVSLAGNHAQRFGGGVSTFAANATLRNVSSYANTAGSGGGFSTWALTNLRHVSSLNDRANGGSGGSLHIGVDRVRVLGSVLANGCQILHGILDDFGGNAQVSGQMPCVGAQISQRGLGLDYGYYGGVFDIVGISLASSPLRNFIPIVRDTRIDVRGWLRSGLADVGAHEFDGISTR